jgi:hypothetical protein
VIDCRYRDEGVPGVMYTLVGQVTNRRGARLHLAIHGWAYCGSGSGRILKARDVRPSDRGHLCRRCASVLAIRLRLDYSLICRRRDQGSRTLADVIADMIDEVDPLTAGEEAKLDQLRYSLTPAA